MLDGESLFRDVGSRAECPSNAEAGQPRSTCVYRLVVRALHGVSTELNVGLSLFNAA